MTDTLFTHLSDLNWLAWLVMLFAFGFIGWWLATALRKSDSQGDS